jgi:polyhydroxyalkanoate synthesis repressor PhaR
MAILIKRYANRKLYNTQTSRYITLKGIAELLEAGEEVCVVDNETGEDITSVALSQILVDSERTNTSPSPTLISQIFGRGGDALYGALRRGMDDASENLEELGERVRRMVGAEGVEPGRRSRPPGGREREREAERPGLGSWIHQASPDLEKLVQTSVERVFRLLDLPRRSDIEKLNSNLERVADAVEMLEKAFERREERGDLDREVEPTEGDERQPRV